MEKEMNMIAEGQKTKQEVLKSAITEMHKIFNEVVESKNKMLSILKAKYHKNLSDNKITGRAAVKKNSDKKEYYSSTSNGQVMNRSNPKLLDTEFWKCPQCKSNKMRFKLTKKNTVFISWNGYPACSNIFQSPNGIEHLEILDRYWDNCKKYGRGNVNLFKLEFYTDFWNENVSDYLPSDDNTAGEFWVYEGCDKAYIAVMNAFMRYPKKEYNLRIVNANGLPNYYQKQKKPLPKTKKDSKKVKPKNSSKRVVKEWDLCGKKRHMKTSNCPKAKK